MTQDAHRAQPERPTPESVREGTVKITCRRQTKIQHGEIMIHNRYLGAGLLACSLAFASITLAQEPDNSKTNKQAGATADQQRNNLSDRDLTKNIRKAIVADKSLSTYAHNVKVISQNGSVTLKGPVRSEDEKKTIVAKAVEVAGSSDKVTDELTVKPE
jgi:hyperosmotically inducible protein